MWREATVDVERSVDLQPDESIARMQVAYIGALAGDLEAYRRTCRTLLDKFGQSQSVDDLERTCKAPLLVKGEFALSQLPVKHFEELIKPEIPDTGPTYWACITRALVACQAGEPEQALNWLAKREPPRGALHVYTYSRLVRAQALFLLGQVEEARAAFDEAEGLIPADLLEQVDHPRERQTLLSPASTHGDWLILVVLRGQTKALLGGQS
jgi:tetratricopeptide (TPR) repeat protein